MQSGQDVYRSVTSSFYRGASIVFLVYATNNRDSFDHLHEWIEYFYEKGSKEAFVFVVGTKSDLPDSQVSSE
jgi:GTPase SAR1 family protein